LSRNLEIGHAWFDGDPAVRNIHVDHAIEARKTDDNTARYWQRTTRQPRTVTAGHERHAVTRAGSYEVSHFLSGSRKDHDRRRLTEMRQRVALVCHQLQRLGQNAVIAADLSTIFYERKYIVHR
jgi:hypothetical protein